MDTLECLKRTLHKEKTTFDEIVKHVIRWRFQAKNSLFEQ
jgi:hypothetical protein